MRPIQPDDAPRLQALHGRLSRETVHQRFFSAKKRLPTNWARFLAKVDYRRRLALVLERGQDSDPELIGVGRYEPTDDPTTAEVAFVVEDRWQNKGLGTALFTELLRAAVDRGIRRFRGRRPGRQPAHARPHRPLRQRGIADPRRRDRQPRLHAAAGQPIGGPPRCGRYW
jgi:GNAT superfamily N-acetyltransferase